MNSVVIIDGESGLDIYEDGEGEKVFVDNLGTSKHDELIHRDYPDQHPISAIEGLSDVLNSKATQKIDTSAMWATRTTYIPKAGEVIVYSDYAVKDGVPIPNIKIGDGLAYVVDLPFILDDARYDLANHASNSAIHVTPEEKLFWNNKVTTDEIDIENERLILTKL